VVEYFSLYLALVTAVTGVCVALLRRAWQTPACKRDWPLSARPIRDCDPFWLGVHLPVKVDTGGRRLPALPPYLRRIHDEQLEEKVARARERSQIVVLVGGSATGKTRACWEAVQPLDGWRLWHPIYPDHRRELLDSIDHVGPHTVVWLNEAQLYLAPTGGGQEVAAALRKLLGDRRRGPVLILGTLWPEHWETLTTRAVGLEDDRHPQARELLAHADITIPGAFAAAELRRLEDLAAADPRLRLAQAAKDGKVTQYLAGGAVLPDRYDRASPAARAVITAAMDARRLGHGPHLPAELLRTAAPGYLTDDEWDSCGDDWFPGALRYAQKEIHGVRMLIRVRPRPDEQPTGSPLYRLHDILEQQARAERAGAEPPDSFWRAAREHARSGDDKYELAAAARRHNLREHAEDLYQQAGEAGEPDAFGQLAELREEAGDHAAAERLALRAAAAGYTWFLATLAIRREKAGDAGGADRVFQLAADGARQGDLADHGAAVFGVGDDDEFASPLEKLAMLREEAGDQAGSNGCSASPLTAGSFACWPTTTGLPLRWRPSLAVARKRATTWAPNDCTTWRPKPVTQPPWRPSPRCGRGPGTMRVPTRWLNAPTTWATRCLFAWWPSCAPSLICSAVSGCAGWPQLPGIRGECVPWIARRRSWTNPKAAPSGCTGGPLRLVTRSA
jgi:hypothetical protein